ncbi:MAG TPA: 2-phospho-L-lactate transferase [Nitrososphaerales archaeon]|nr:2-phospho-L-lactate transferase [Nitrososphaerales archaeon]
MKRTKVVALSGGTGSAKLLRGLASEKVDLTVVGNVGDNFWFHGIYVCPDIDIALYTLAGTADYKRGWGIEGDSFNAMAGVSSLGGEDWFRMGDRDLALSILRTELMAAGESLTTVTERFRGSLGVGPRVLPATDKHIETRVKTPSGDLHLQEFWVRERGEPEVLEVSTKGIRGAQATEKVVEAIMAADRVVFCPANPITSIRPILAITGIRRALTQTKARIVGVSPMVGDSPFSGPAGKFLRASGIDPTSLGVASEYSGLLDAFLIQRSDSSQSRRINDLGIKCVPTDISLATQRDRARVAGEVLAA